MKHLLLIVALALLTTAKAQDKPQIKIFCDKSQSTISYSMSHPLHSWVGVSKEVNSVILADEKREQITQVAATVKISSFNSRNANRDSHAMEVTEALLYPSISFTSDDIKQNGDSLEVTGILNFHHVNQMVSFKAKKEKLKNKVRITGAFKLKMTQFDIQPPSLMGMATRDEFEISFSIVY